MNQLPWIEKYRPTNLNNIIGNDNIIDQFKSIAKNGNMPHMLLVGPPGTGKTTSIICLAKELLKDNFSEGFLELNASNERGIDIKTKNGVTSKNQKGMASCLISFKNKIDVCQKSLL